MPTFAHDEPDLKSMYLGLLASSMDARVAGDVHPAFVEIIKQLDSREAKYLENLLAFAGNTYPIVEIRRVTAGQPGWFPVFRHLMRLTDDVSGLPSEDARFPASVDNWIRLGLVDVMYGTYLSGDNQYAWVELQPEYCRLTELHRSENVIVKFERGILRITELGNQFAIAVGLRRAK